MRGTLFQFGLLSILSTIDGQTIANMKFEYIEKSLVTHKDKYLKVQCEGRSYLTILQAVNHNIM